MKEVISILIVEDEALIAENIKNMLQDFGYAISGICYNYDSALAAFELLDFDLVVTDINLGKGIDTENGIMLMHQLRSIKNCPIVYLTAFGDLQTVKKAALTTPSAYLLKPTNAASLFAAVQIAFDNFYTNTATLHNLDSANEFFYSKSGKKMRKIFWKDVYHLEALKNYVRIRTTQLHYGVMLRGSLLYIWQDLMPKPYRNKMVKISRAQAIRKDLIIAVQNGRVETPHGSFSCNADFSLESLV